MLRSFEGHAYSSVLHEFFLSGTIPAFLESRIWRIRQWARRVLLSRPARLEAKVRATGYARAVVEVNRLSSHS